MSGTVYLRANCWPKSHKGIPMKVSIVVTALATALPSGAAQPGLMQVGIEDASGNVLAASNFTSSTSVSAVFDSDPTDTAPGVVQLTSTLTDGDTYTATAVALDINGNPIGTAVTQDFTPTSGTAPASQYNAPSSISVSVTGV
jgi:hypothetical protein